MDRTKIVGVVQYFTWKHNGKASLKWSEVCAFCLRSLVLIFNTFDLELAS